jgi:hypothetical protein
MSKPKNQKQKSFLSLEGWKTIDKSIALRARAALEKFSPTDLALLYAVFEYENEQLRMILDDMLEGQLNSIKLLGEEIKKIPDITQVQESEVNEHMSIKESLEKMRQLGQVEASYKSHHRAKQAVDAKHNKPGGSRQLQAKIRAIWATGKFSSKDLCAEQECGALGMSFASARRALRNQPEPS